MENPFDDKIEELEFYRWLSVEECSEKLQVSKRTIFQYLKDGKIRGVKWKNRRLVDSVSVIGYMLERRVIEFEQLKSEETKRMLRRKLVKRV